MVWIVKNKKRALIIKGLRQIGKTTIVRKFCEEYYENVVYIDFMHNVFVKSLFDMDLNVNDWIISLSTSNLGAKFISYKTVIIFDELQECANDRSSIKPFMEDDRFDIICIESLLELRGYNKKVSKGVSTGFEKVIFRVYFKYNSGITKKLTFQVYCLNVTFKKIEKVY